MSHLLLVGDFVRHTGFARVNEAIATGLQALGWQVSVMGIRYNGDATPLQKTFNLYPAEAAAGDYYGITRLPAVIAHTRPDIVLIVNDPWIVDDYLSVLTQVPELPPIAAYMPIDGPNLNPARQLQLKQLDLAVAYTDFGARELAAAGLDNQEIAVIPHGIDLDLFQPGDQAAARKLLGLPDGFVVLLCDANASRKRLDLAITAFARFAHDHPESMLLIHSEMVSQWGWDLRHLVQKAGIMERTRFTGKHGKLTNEKLRMVYAASDVFLSATMGEGWGFGSMEAMACGVPAVAPRWAALGEWADESALLVDVDPDQTFTYVASANQEGGVVRPQALVDALSILYRDKAVWGYWAEMGLKRVREPRFRWENIAAQWATHLRACIRQSKPVPLVMEGVPA